METFKKRIDSQIDFNKGKNLFNIDSLQSMKFIGDTLKSIQEIALIDKETEYLLVNYATDKCLREFCRVNQYFSFSSNDTQNLRNIYSELFTSIKNQELPTDKIAENHYRNLKDWLSQTNSFAQKIYVEEENIIHPITCSEYSAELQIDILKLHISEINTPILDIGCGVQGHLVKYLQSKGIEAYGIDRFVQSESFLSEADWLEYSYNNLTWGTIVSNLGFSNHFCHHHLRNDGNFLEYAKKYMQILSSLKVGGKFHYAPSLQFIENYLDKEKFKIEYFSIKNCNFNTTVIERLKE
ncbi:MAG: hypothetical protein AB7S50_03750 [Bacteroidales bacterium]